MLIAEELALLLYEDDRGAPSVDSTKLDYALGGAILVELAMKEPGSEPGSERVRITEENEPGVRKGRLVVSPGSNPDDPVLAEAIVLLRTQQGRKPKEVLGKLRKLSGGLRTRLLRRLSERGILRYERRKVWRIFPIDRWPTADPAAERTVRDRLHQCLVVGQQPDARTSALISILSAIDHAHKALQLTDRGDRRQARDRAKQIAKGDWTGQAVKKALEELQAAVIAGSAGGS